MKRCPECGREYPDDYGFCEEDATPLQASSPVVSRVPETAGLPAIPQSQIVLGLLATVALVALVIGWKVWAHPMAPGRLIHMPDPAPQDTHIAQETPPVTPLAEKTPDPQAVAAAEGAYESDEGAPAAKDVAWKTYKNTELGVELEYPATWTVQVTTYPGRQRVQFTGGPDVSVGLDVSPSPYQTLTEWDEKHAGRWIWGDLEAGYLKRKKTHYHRQRIGSAALGDVVATSWEFTVQPDGKPLVRKWDVGTLYHGKGYAIVYEAPDAQFSQARPAFEHMTTTMKFQVESP